MTRRERSLRHSLIARSRPLCGALALTWALARCSNPATPTDPGSTVGDISVTVTTTGPDVAIDPDGYTVAVDNGSAQAISSNNGSATFSALNAGDHYLLFGGVAMNCTVTGGNPLKVSVTAGKVVEVSVLVTCLSVGSVQITVTTSGAWPPENGYMFSVDGTPTLTISTNGGSRFDLPAGDHRVALIGPAWNCTVSDPNPATVTVTIGAVAQVTFKVTCAGGATGGQIAFTSDRGGCPEIYAMNADGSRVGELFGAYDGYCGAYASDAAWSPDGTKIAFDIHPTVSWVGLSPWIVVMNADGTLHDLYPHSTDGRTPGFADPAWSPDGTRIAGTRFWGCSIRGGCGGAGGSPSIFVANADGSALVVLAAGATPSWSPDGRIAFANLGDIYVMNTMARASRI